MKEDFRIKVGRREFARARIDPSEDLGWFYPSEVVRKLEALAEVCGIDPSRPAGKPLPELQELEVLERLVQKVFLDGPAEDMARRYDLLSPPDRRYFDHLVISARGAALREQAARPSTPLGVPRGKSGTWANLLTASWIPMPDDWIAIPRDE